MQNTTKIACRTGGGSSKKKLLAAAPILAAALLATTGLSTPAFAQAADNLPLPVRQYVDENSVDLLSGEYSAYSPELRIGSSEMGLSFLRQVRVRSFHDAAMGTITSSDSTYTVDVAGKSEVFTLSGSAFTPVEQNGSTLVLTGSTYTYTQSDGAIATFDSATYSFGNATGISVTGLTYPSGRTLTYYYVTATYTDSLGILRTGRRLQSVTTNAGYHMKFSYESDVATSSSYVAWGRIANVKGLNSATDSCSVTAFSCPQTGRPELSIPQPTQVPGPSGYAIHTYVDAEGRTTTFRMDGGSATRKLTKIRLPGSTSDDVSIAYSGDRVSSLTKLGVTTDYASSDVGNVRTVTVTRPGGATRVVTFDIAKSVMLTDQNELGKTTSYQYDTNNRLTRVTRPEGNYTELTYDARGNLTQTLFVPKSGSGLGNVTLTAGYDATCTNVVKCNQPNFIKDGKGNQTDYTYDPTHGGLLTATLPAPSAGATRPQTRITYTRLDASGAPSGAGIFMPTATSACQTLASCTGAADEVKATIGYGQGLLPASISKGAGDSSLTATAAMTYDLIGNLTYVDGPLPGTADTRRALYNQDRELVGTIASDPDGAGSLKNRAIRLTYRADGQVSKREIGTVNGQSDTDWSAFSALQTVDIGYDSNARPVTSKLSSGGTSYALTQTSYDALGRVDCTAVRMNTAIYGALPASACTLGTQGSFGPDRISQAVYDAAGQVTQAKVAVGTGDAATERTLTYSNNGQLATLKDAESNLTTYEYDGFDRLSKTQFPTATPKGAGTSDATKYEQLSYDANSNVTSRRLRDATSILYTYDNLNRVTVKDLPGSEPDVSYVYDNLGRVTSASQTGNALAFTWDALSRRLTETGPQGTATSEYDLANRRTKLTYPGTGLYVTTDYLVTGEATAIRENGAASGVGVLASYGYDNLGNRTSVTFGNGAAQAYSYDPVSRLASLTNDLTGTTNDLSTTFAYNPASQIASTVRTGDAYAWTGHYNVNRGYTSTGLNQYSAAGPASFTYDAKGNLTSDGTSAFGYSSENLLTSAPGSTSLAYDPALRLYQIAGASTTRFAYDGVAMIAEYNGSNALQRRYVFGPGVDAPIVQYEGAGTTDRRFMSADERGSVISLTDSSGALLNLNRYDEYGTPQSTNAGRFQYTGQAWLGEIGMQYSKARIYSPTLGRFLQTDPIGYGDGPNWYAYVHNDPVNWVDPLGLCNVLPCSGDIVIVSSIGVGLGAGGAGGLIKGILRQPRMPGESGGDEGVIVIIGKHKSKPKKQTAASIQAAIEKCGGGQVGWVGDGGDVYGGFGGAAVEGVFATSGGGIGTFETDAWGFGLSFSMGVHGGYSPDIGTFSEFSIGVSGSVGKWGGGVSRSESSGGFNWSGSRVASPPFLKFGGSFAESFTSISSFICL